MADLVYKLVSINRLKNGKREFESYAEWDHRLTYAIQEKTTPAIGQIFVFKDPGAIKDFLYMHLIADISILLCESGELTRIELASIRSADEEKFWESWDVSKNRLSDWKSTMFTPLGSYCTPWVIPTRELTGAEISVLLSTH